MKREVSSRSRVIDGSSAPNESKISSNLGITNTITALTTATATTATTAG